MAKQKFIEVKSSNVNGIFEVVANKGIAWLVKDEAGDTFSVQKRLVVRGPWEEDDTPEPTPAPSASSLAGQLASAAAPKPAPRKDKPAPAERDPNLVTLKELCFELGIVPRIARRKLRKAVGTIGIGSRWEWIKDSPELAKVRQALAAPTAQEEADAEEDMGDSNP